jgi:hypothetical protein
MWLDWLRSGIEDATEAELIEDLRAGRAQIWPGETAAMVTQVLDTPEGRALHVWVAGGALDGIMALKPGVEAWGRAMGCQFVSINSRPGWARLLRDDGFAPVGGELRKPL